MKLTEEEQKYAAHLQRFIQCATVSNANVKNSMRPSGNSIPTSIA